MKNEFCDLEDVSPSILPVVDPGPYTSPSSVHAPVWDKTLAKRMFYAFSVLTIAYLSFSAIGWWQVFRFDPHHSKQPLKDVIVRFISDWKA